MRRISRKEDTPVTIIKEGISVPEEVTVPTVITPTRQVSGLVTPLKPPKTEKRVPCHLFSKNGMYRENGNVILFPSKGAAKKKRNELNRGQGSEVWWVAKAMIPDEKALIQAEPENSMLEEMDEMDIFTWGYWGCI